MKYYIIFFDETQKEINENLYNAILDETASGAIGKEIDGSFYKFSDIRKILNENDFKDQYPDKIPYNYGQPYSQKKIEETLGYEGIIKKATKTSHIEALIRGFEKENKNPKNNLLKLMKQRLRQIKNGEVITTVVNKKTYNPKYKTLEEAKNAGAI